MKEKQRRSKTLAALAKQLGAEVEDPVGFDPQSQRFYTLEDYAREKAAIEEAHLIWLLNFGQQDRPVVTPTDRLIFESFVSMYAASEFESSVEAIHKLANETVADVRRFIVEHAPWELPLPGMKRIVEWAGPYRISAFRTDDRQTAFRFHATELLCEHGDRIRTCKRDDCKRLFLAADKRQIFCSRPCSQKAQFEKYVKGIGGKIAWRKKHREQYHERKKAKE